MNESEQIECQDEELVDLPVTEEQAERATGGPMNYGAIRFEYVAQRDDRHL
ncbi:MAG TPA: hypothetical protein VG778_09695 [Blastocatellia bacterium]|nr:hypothetical protein [Blastocatellia bacterium]